MFIVTLLFLFLKIKLENICKYVKVSRGGINVLIYKVNQAVFLMCTICTFVTISLMLIICLFTIKGSYITYKVDEYKEVVATLDGGSVILNKSDEIHLSAAKANIAELELQRTELHNKRVYVEKVFDFGLSSYSVITALSDISGLNKVSYVYYWFLSASGLMLGMVMFLAGVIKVYKKPKRNLRKVHVIE